MLSLCDSSQIVASSFGSVCLERQYCKAAIPPILYFQPAKCACIHSSGVSSLPATTSSFCAMNFLFAAARLSASSAFLLAATMRASFRHESSDDCDEDDDGLGVLLLSLSTAVDLKRPIWYCAACVRVAA